MSKEPKKEPSMDFQQQPDKPPGKRVEDAAIEVKPPKKK
jgi:hypothetical protein